MNVIELRHQQNVMRGKCHCCSCRYEWEDVAPPGVDWFECPQCHLLKARWLHPAVPYKDDLIWVCACGCDAFIVTGKHPPTIFCINCGLEQLF